MPVNFSQYIVDPWQGVKEANAMNLRRNALMQEQRNADRRNLLAERELGMREQDSNMKLIGTQASVFSKAFKGVTDDASYQNLLRWMDQIGQSELGKSKFFQNIRSSMPKEYNPQDQENAIKFMDSLTQDPSGGSLPGSIQEFMFAKNQGYDGNYMEWMSNRKDQSQAPNTVREYEYAKANGYSGTYQDWMRDRRPPSGIGDTGVNPDEEFSPDEIDYHAQMYNLRGTLPALGMGKSRLRSQILKRAAQLANDQGGAAEALTTQADMAGMKSSIAQQEKQLGSMGSFVRNLELQVDKVGELAKELETFDTRLLNVPLRAVRGRFVGSPQQAKYDMYLAEIESEIGKLATGSTGSVAELSQGAQERWAKIHDKNLSIKDMLALLEETKQAGKIRYRSVEDQLDETRKRMRRAGKRDVKSDVAPEQKEQPATQAPQTADDYLKKFGGQ